MAMRETKGAEERGQFVVAANEAGNTLAAVLRAHMPSLSWNRARELCATGRVLVGGHEERDAHIRVTAGMEIDCDANRRKRREGVLDPGDVLHLDTDIIVINKRADTLTVPFDGERDTLVDQVRAYLMREQKHRTGTRVSAEVGVVQRLDKDTTGSIVFTRTLQAKRALDEQIRAHSAERRYLALVHGTCPSGTHRTFLVQDRGDGYRGSWGTRKHHVGDPPFDAKESVTHVRLVEALGTASLIECRLETGRQHQIRIHVSEAGHPLLGERVYDRRADPAHPRPLLHAAFLAFVHPRTRQVIRFEAPLPHDFQTKLEALRRAFQPA